MAVTNYILKYFSFPCFPRKFEQIGLEEPPTLLVFLSPLNQQRLQKSIIVKAVIRLRRDTKLAKTLDPVNS